MSTKIETLEPRFREPENWRWHTISRSLPSGEVRNIRVGSVQPDSSQNNGTPPQAMIVCLPGLSEFGEKYFETAHWALEKNMGFCVIDWVGQGLSSRYLDNPHKRHSAGFNEDIIDLDLWLRQYVLGSAVVTDKGRLPMIMLGHSLGGNLGLRYLQTHPDVFDVAAFSAPMIGIKGLSHLPGFVAQLITSLFAKFKPEEYIPGARDWALQPSVENPAAILTSDPTRGCVHNIYSEEIEEARLGGVTYKWLNEAVASCRAVRKKKALRQIDIPVLLTAAGHEKLVSNRHIKRAASLIPRSTYKYFRHSKHEILMEVDAIREPFLDLFYDGIQQHLVSSSGRLKRF